jgi:hypothetical protein
MNFFTILVMFSLSWMENKWWNISFHMASAFLHSYIKHEIAICFLDSVLYIARNKIFLCDYIFECVINSLTMI